MNPLFAFALVGHQNDRHGFWIRFHTLRDCGAGPIEHHTADLDYAYAARLANKLCDKYGITDRACLMTGRIFTVRAAK